MPWCRAISQTIHPAWISAAGLYGARTYEFVMLFLILRTGGIQADERDIDVLADDFIVGAYFTKAGIGHA